MKRARAQSLSEYAIGMLVVILALIAMQVYVKRGLQGRYIDLVSQATARINQDSGGISQYEPYYVTAQVTIDMPRNLGTIIGRDKVTKNLSATSTTVKGRNTEGVNPD